MISSLPLFFFLVVLGFELQALCFLGRRATIWATSPDLFTPLFLELGSHFLPRLTWTMIILFYLYNIAGWQVCTIMPRLLVEMGTRELFAWLAVNHNPPDLSLLNI
jgi:hypothetical protein